jgi:hypothetical protein
MLLATNEAPATIINVEGGCTLALAIQSANNDTAVGQCTDGSATDRLVLQGHRNAGY